MPAVQRTKLPMADPTLGRRATDEKEVTTESIRAIGQAMGLTEAQIAAAIEAVMKAEEE